MDNLLFRCSAVGALLTEPKAKADKEAGKLSETAKTLVQSMWLEKTFGYREFVNTDAMDKGLMLEQDSMALAQEVLGGQFRVKNREKFSNDYIIGTPDIILSDCIEDIKTSWSLRTFYEAEPTTLYKVQAQCYMALKGIESYRLIYCLVPNTDESIINECEKLSWKFGKNYDNEDYIEQCQQIKRNNDLINEIPKENRIKVFEFKYNEAQIQQLYRQIEKARVYYNSLEMPCYIATHDQPLNTTIYEPITP
jgi:hypothetical protein